MLTFIFDAGIPPSGKNLPSTWSRTAARRREEIERPRSPEATQRPAGHCIRVRVQQRIRKPHYIAPFSVKALGFTRSLVKKVFAREDYRAIISVEFGLSSALL
ncbi:hypothetical protein TSAR_008748 [Trichomalopsis sarcophagae]|uniref:Uncharacterized protein n=1 Tax=Trichomalopsis sarcophagae TaxID=543379 RepID=A0A232F671_9HYME|nr:hypothetical protein TSAR_008748 [Trichomalopsis sarcophagae]